MKEGHPVMKFQRARGREPRPVRQGTCSGPPSLVSVCGLVCTSCFIHTQQSHRLFTLDIILTRYYI